MSQQLKAIKKQQVLTSLQQAQMQGIPLDKIHKAVRNNPGFTPNIAKEFLSKLIYNMKNFKSNQRFEKIEKIIEELPELLVKHAYQKLKSGEELTASEMKVCLEVCKTYSSEKLGAKPDNILEKVPFDTNG